MYFSNILGLSLTEGHVQTVLQKSRVFEYKALEKILKCFSSSPSEMMKRDLSLKQLSKMLFEGMVQECQWWSIGMKLIRCCGRKKIDTVHELMKNVANYNHSGKLLFFDHKLHIQLFFFAKNHNC